MISYLISTILIAQIAAQNGPINQATFSPAIAEGYWELIPEYSEDVGDFTCDQKPMQIIIDISSMRYESIRKDYHDHAKILSVGDDHFWIRYDNEERLDDDGNPVEWAWVQIDEQQFYWVRRDWLTQNNAAGTAPRRRCPGPDMTS